MSHRLSTTEALNFVLVDDDSDLKLFPEGYDDDDGTDINFDFSSRRF